MIDGAPRLRKDGSTCPPFGQRRNGSAYVNKCDHDPARPRLELLRPIPKGMPPVIYQLIERCERIYTHPHEFPELSFSWLSRGRRSERREAVVLVCKALFLRMDLASARVGQPIPGTGFLEGIPIDQLAAWAGLTHSRAARAVEDLTHALYQAGKLDARGRRCAPQPREVKTDPATGERAYRSRPAVRRFERLVFRRLRLTIEVDAAAKRASRKRAELAARDLNARQAQERQKRAQLYATREARILDKNSAASKAAEAARLAEEATARRRVEIGIDVWRGCPDMPPEQRRAEVERRLADEQRATGPPE